MMQDGEPITLLAYPPSPTPVERFFERKRSRSQRSKKNNESDLLKSVRAALQGSQDEPDEEIHREITATVDGQDGLDELAWDDHTVVWSAGGVVKCTWDFAQEKQRIQYAVLAWILADGGQSSEHHVPGGSARYAAEKEEDAWIAQIQTTKGDRDPFSPFFSARRERLKRERFETTTVVRTVFVFLRSFGRAFLMNGLEHTFSLPFIVRRAWAVQPHGVLLERVVEPAELAEPAPLPRLYTLAHAFREPRPVGQTEGIRGGIGGHRLELPAYELDGSRATREVHAKEQVLIVIGDIMVTLDNAARRLSFWRWVFAPQKDVPPAPARPPTAKRPSGSQRRGPPLANDKQAQSRMASLTRRDLVARDDRIREPSPEFDEPTEPDAVADMAAFAAVPGMPPPTTAAAALASFGSAGAGAMSPMVRTRRNSLNRNDLSSTMDRMMLGRRSETELHNELQLAHRAVLPDFWTEKVYEYELTDEECEARDLIHFGLFDQRFDGKTSRNLLGMCIPGSQRLEIFKIHFSSEDRTMKMTHSESRAGVLSVASVRATRNMQKDLLILKSDSTLEILTFDLRVIPIQPRLVNSDGYTSPIDVSMADMDADGDASMMSESGKHGKIIAMKDRTQQSTISLVYENGTEARLALDLVPTDFLVYSLQHILSVYCKSEVCFQIMRRFIAFWTAKNKSESPSVQFDCLAEAILGYYGIAWKSTEKPGPEASTSWDAMMSSQTHFRLRDDSALVNIMPASKSPPPLESTVALKPSDISALHVILMALHVRGEEMRLHLHMHESLLRLSTLTLRLSQLIRPAFADLLKRLFPSSGSGWKSGIWVTSKGEIMLPPDVSSAIYARLAQPESQSRLLETLACRAHQSFVFGQIEPHALLREFTHLFSMLSDPTHPDSRKRSELTVQQMVGYQFGLDFLNLLPLSISAPLREAARTCQLGPPRAWPVTAYEFVGRTDLTESGKITEDLTFNNGYRTVKDHLKTGVPRKSFAEMLEEAHRAVHHGEEAITGVEMEKTDYIEVRFGHDRRLQEVARMLCSSIIPTIRMPERPDLSDHDFAKEQQMQVLRTAERTLALPFGRAMLTFANVPSVKREVYTIPKIELSIRLQPHNVVIGPEPGKMPIDGLQWAEFHNGVAAALRIAPASETVDSSWISFNRPNDLTPEHAGFLYGLGLTGYLKDMLTWHAFGYLTPKHDHTSIGILLGLSAAHMGTQSRPVSKLLAVHTPAFLPSPNADLNVPLATQSAGLVGVGLLYMASKHRRMAEVALQQISRPDFLHPDLNNESREAYTMAAALSFGMIMLGRGTATTSPADIAILSRLRVLIHGDGLTTFENKLAKPTFDINLTSPAATLALGLMYLKTERQSIADILTIPDSVAALNHIQPSFLLVRTIARNLIMWRKIRPNRPWLLSQVPEPIMKIMETRSPHEKVDDAIELAYYHITGGALFALALKYAGTADLEVYQIISEFYEFFRRQSMQNSLAFNHRIKRAAMKDGLSIVTLAMGIVMAGTGELNCLRRLRLAHGMFNQPTRYGAHMGTHMALGLLFLGGGRVTLGNSDAAIACMIAAFYPHFPALSSDNRGYLPALRHLWVLATEPRCLIARDVDTKEVVYLPMKITVKDEDEKVSAVQLIGPTLIPAIDRVMSIKIESPRYWPFFLDIANNKRHFAGLLRSQTIFVKRRTMFLSYLEDPKGSRSLFVRSGMSTGDAAMLDFPELTDTTANTSSDLQHYINSHANDVSFIAFADRFCRHDGTTKEEKIFNAFCHSALLDCIIQDKPQTLSSYLALYRARALSPKSRYFPLVQQDLVRTDEFYKKLWERRFSGPSDNVMRPSLLRDNAIHGALFTIDARLNAIAQKPEFREALRAYVNNQSESMDMLRGTHYPELDQHLAWYLQRHAAPYAPYYPAIREVAEEMIAELSQKPAPNGILGTNELERLQQSAKILVHASIANLVRSFGTWTIDSFNDVLEIWQSNSNVP